MGFWLRFFWQSAQSRRLALSMVVFSIGLSAALLLTVQQVRTDARASFSQAVGGVDLIVGPRGSATDLLLYSLFQLGRPTRNIDAQVLDQVRSLPMVDWAIPLQLGDSYRGFAVWGTTPLLFGQLKTQGQPLQFAQGRSFDEAATADDPRRAVYEVVLGAQVAQRFGHALGDRLVVTHGAGNALDQDHADQPFTLVGILAPTGAPIDRAVIISVQGFEALHQGWGQGAFSGFRPGISLGSGRAGLSSGSNGVARTIDLSVLQPQSYTALLVGLQSRLQIFQARDAIEALPGPALMAVMPGVTLDELWQSIALIENTLTLLTAMVALTGLLSIAAVLMVSMSGRRRELAVLRALGMSPRGLMVLALAESFWVGLAGIIVGLVLHQLGLWMLSDWLRLEFGLSVHLGLPSMTSLALLSGLLLAAVFAGLLPAFRAYRLSLADGLNPPHLG
ncbi:MAG: hypothetical protein RL258_1651, partial [Pseudomonadota bacterium]